MLSHYLHQLLLVFVLGISLSCSVAAADKKIGVLVYDKVLTSDVVSTG